MEFEGVLDLSDLRIFLNIADLASVTKAADDLGLPKSSVSRSLTRLEATVGVTLVERTTRQFALTEAGRLLQRRGRDILDDVEDAQSVLRGLDSMLEGELRVEAPPELAFGVIAPMTERFLGRHPGLRLVLTTPSARNGGPMRAPDLTLSAGYHAAKGDETTAIGSAPLHLFARTDHPGLEAVVDVEALDGFRMVRTSGYDRDPQPFRSSAASKGGAAGSSIIVDDPLAALGLIGAGAGIGLLPHFLAERHTGVGGLRRLLPAHDFGSLRVSAVPNGDRRAGARRRAFLAAFAEELGAPDP